MVMVMNIWENEGMGIWRYGDLKVWGFEGMGIWSAGGWRYGSFELIEAYT